jgi:outer membrane protein TolC
MAEAQWQDSEFKVSKLEELLIGEKSSIRTALGLPLGTDLIIQKWELGPSRWENNLMGEIAKRALSISPEDEQLNHLLQAAKYDKFAKIFAFISNASMSSSSGSTNPFANMTTSIGFYFGVDLVFDVKLASNNMESVRIRKEQLKQDDERLAETLVGQLVEIKKQREYTDSTLAARLTVYDAQKRQFDAGLITLQTLLQTQVLLEDAYINKVRSEEDLTLERITLQRLVIDGDFTKVKGCAAADPPERRRSWRERRRDREKPPTLDEACNGRFID